MNNLNKTTIVLCTLSLLNACSNKTLNNKFTHDNFYSTLWLQTASESKALSYQAYNAAQSHLQQAINDLSWTASLAQTADFQTLPAAVIIDVDETILNNAQFQAKMVLDGVLYDDQEWDRWVALKSAPALPGAVEFINMASRLGVEMFYITNRDCRKRPDEKSQCPQKADTISNLKNVGIKGIKAENVMLKYEKSNWLSEKQSRRDEVIKSHRVLMLVGDDLGDFLPHVKQQATIRERNVLVKQHESLWGRKWIVLSNPTYGSWMSILDDDQSQYLQGY